MTVLSSSKVGAKQVTTSFLRWAGSKRKLLPVLENYWLPKYSRYVEPFAGSACFFFRSRPKRSLLGDINAELILTYLEVKYRPSSLLSELSKFTNDRDSYLRVRAMDPSTLSKDARAARFIYLNRFCFNGLYRTNRAGQFNVPYGGERSGSLPTADDIYNCSRSLKHSTLLAGSFEKVMEKVVPGDFVYMDPPYSVKNVRTFTEYSPSVFGNEKLQILREWMETLDKRNIDFLVSYADSEEAEILAKGFETRKVRVRRNISGFADSRKDSMEVLIFRNSMGGVNEDSQLGNHDERQ